MSSVEDSDINIKRLIGYDEHAEYELDLVGLDGPHAQESVSRMLERSRFRASRSIIVRLEPATPGGGETLFQPIGRQLLEARRTGILIKLSPLPTADGFYVMTLGRESDEDGPEGADETDAEGTTVDEFVAETSGRESLETETPGPDDPKPAE